jgi:hypothetical protein
MIGEGISHVIFSLARLLGWFIFDCVLTLLAEPLSFFEGWRKKKRTVAEDESGER